MGDTKTLIKKLNLKEKLQLIDMLWNDILTRETEIPSPSWHENILKDRKEAVEKGIEKILDWEKAKESIINETKNFRRSDKGHN